MKPRNVKLVIRYDGSAYHGWQFQPGLSTVEGTLREALEKLCGGVIHLNGSSRTDAGVHALGQVANVRMESPVPTENLVKALNNLLPEDIAIAEAVEMPEAFDAISDTKRKRYRYTICTEPIRPVLAIRYCWHRPGVLNTFAMQAAAARLVGTFDFKSFASAADQRQSSVRKVFACHVAENGSFITIDVEADGFLYNMVRNIVGTLVEVGRGRWEPEIIDPILAAKDRAAAGPIAPAGGLCLMEIYY